MYYQYNVINNMTHKSHKFDRAEQVSVFMWGKDHRDYTIIKSKKVRVPDSIYCITRLQQYLEDA